MGRRIPGESLAVLVLLSLGAAMITPRGAEAIRLQGTSSTAFYSQEVSKSGAGDDFENRTRAFERLRFDVFELGTPNLSFHGSLTARNDLSNQSLGDTRTRLYNGYLEYRPRPAGTRKLCFQSRLGRQWVTAGVGTGTMDGLLVQFDRPEWGGLTVYGGTLGIDSREELRIDSPDDSRRIGAELRIRPRVSETVSPEIKASFADTRRDDADESRRLGLRGALRFRRQLQLWTELRHDFVLDRTYGTAAGFEYFRAARYLRVWGEYNRRTAALPATSFFAFWDSKPVTQMRGGVGFGIAGPYRANLEVNRTELESETANEASSTEHASAYRIVLQRNAVQLGARIESGFAGDRVGLVASATHRIGERWDLLADLGWQTYDWGSTDLTENHVASGIFAATFKATPTTHITGQLETLNNWDLKQDVRFLLRIDKRFRLGRS
jgi:hypothetical protein